MFARACGNADVHHLEAEDLRALTLEASVITGVPLAGTDFVLTPEAIADRVATVLESRQRQHRSNGSPTG